MKPSDIWKTVQSQLKQLSWQSDATKYYEQQKEALNGIRNTSGLREIRAYWYRTYDEAVTKLWKTDPNNVGEVAKHQSAVQLAKGFLSFLDNLIE